MEDSKMPLTEHLTELRKRILVSLMALFVVFVGVFNYSEKIFDVVTFPLRAELKVSVYSPHFQIVKKTAAPLVFLAPAEAFWMHLKVSLVAALILSLPVIFYQLWRFISPGLLANERKYVLPFVFLATTLFVIGASFCFIIVLPFAITFLLGYKTQNMTPMLSVGSYVDFCLKFVLAFGAIFELPLAIIFLTRLGIVTPAMLAKNRKFAVLFAFIAGAILTPTPDAFNQTLMAVPIIILYEIGILLSRLLYRKKKDA
ncbi:Sec-independent protein translocase protein TatC [Candidatus Sulfobium mesophilum]|uniref:Sec-independent protein translocase protein TatC n=1 Tax=Candidatus Sulfobium mesophilum TaxID=2016548 RepID=A0A2U3QFP0_9BACT|nr:Sec-independent protein translocase protein TatC [Candidatus Sulfobium mesophilum]